ATALTSSIRYTTLCRSDRGIVGFCTYHSRYASGREGAAPAAAFAPRKAATSIYLPDGIDAHAAELAQLDRGGGLPWRESGGGGRSEEHTSELQSRANLV